MRGPVRRRWVLAWAAVVLAAGAATLYLQGEQSGGREPARWERGTPATVEPAPCPSPTRNAPDTRSACTFWKRG